MGEAFNLNDLVSEQLTTSTSPDPHVLWATVVAAVPTKHLRDALVQVGPHLVQRRAGKPQPVTARTPNPSKWVKHGPTYLSYLRVRINVGPLKWKFLGDCDEDDLAYAENERYNRGASIIASGKRYGKIRAAVSEHDVPFVRDLPTEVLRELFR